MSIRVLAATAVSVLGRSLIAAPSKAVTQHFDATGVEFSFNAGSTVGWAAASGFTHRYDSVAPTAA